MTTPPGIPTSPPAVPQYPQQGVVPPAQPNQPQPPMRRCKKCGSSRIQAVSITSGKIKKRGCLGTLFHIFMICITFGLWIIIPMLRSGSHGKIKTKVEFVCLDCGTKQ